MPLVALAAASLLACGSPEPAPAPANEVTPARPNLVLVTLDTTRADRFAAWGNRAGVTPEADRLAAEGVAFLRCVAPSGSTSPSHASLFTGLDPIQHGLRSQGQVLPADVPTLAEALQRAGYQTALFSAVAFLTSGSGLHRGFEIAETPRNRLRARRNTARAVRWILEERAADAPFFVWIHHFDAHSPYRTTYWARRQLGDGQRVIEGPVSVGTFGLGLWMDRPAEAHEIRTRYDGLVHSADEQLGVLLAALETAGELDHTVVVLTADHGQALGEHRVPGHGALWESILRVPLIVWDGRTRVGRQVGERVGLVDLKPTLLELAGLPVPGGLRGRSLVPALRGEPLEPRPYLSQHLPPIVPTVRTDPHQQLLADRRSRLGQRIYRSAVYDGPLKLLEGPDGVVLYDVERDPGEQHPIPPSQRPADHARLAAALADLTAPGATARSADPVPEDVAAQLRALGYAD